MNIPRSEWYRNYNYLSSAMDDFGLMAIAGGKSGALSADNIHWMQLKKNSEVPSPLVYGDYVYPVTNEGWVTCMNAVTGAVCYHEKVAAPGAYIASQVLADGKIYISSCQGIITVIQYGKTPLVISQSKLDGKIMATPAISGNNLYISTSKHIYAFRK